MNFVVASVYYFILLIKVSFYASSSEFSSVISSSCSDNSSALRLSFSRRYAVLSIFDSISTIYPGRLGGFAELSETILGLTDIFVKFRGGRLGLCPVSSGLNRS